MSSSKASSKQHYIYLFSAWLVLLWATMLVTNERMNSVESDVFLAINGLPDWLVLPFLIITQAGSHWMLFAVTLLLLAWRKHRLALSVFGAGATAYLLTELFKAVIQRPRPRLLEPLTQVRDFTAYGYGFPSGHTAVATTLAFLMAALLPRKWRWLAWVWIVLVGLSRTYLGVHSPLDIVGGIAVGVIVVCVVKLVRGKLHFVRKITGLKLTD